MYKKPSHKQFLEEQFEENIRKASVILNIEHLSPDEQREKIAIKIGEEGHKSIANLIKFYDNLLI